VQAADFAETNLDREPLYAQVASRIVNQILAGAVPAGTRLPSERQLSEQFAVSRVVIREAMKVLVRNGIVEIQPGRGTFTVDRTHNSLWQSFDLLRQLQGLDDSKLLEVRAPLEIAIAGLAATRAEAQDVIILETCLQDMEHSDGDVERHMATDERFHVVLAAATRNQLFEALMQSLVVLLRNPRRRLRQLVLARGGPNRALEHHRRILAAVKRRDAAAAEAEMRGHMQQVAEDLAAASAAVAN